MAPSEKAYDGVYRAGVASIVITPTETMWAGGYASRTHPISEKVHDLWAKALMIEDSTGHRVLFLATDLVGIPRGVGELVATRITKELGLARADLLMNSSHTHSGPVLRESLVDIYPMTASDWEVVHRYTPWMEDRLVEVARRAAAHLEPVHLSTAIGRATFAVNRRENKEAEVVPGYKAKGPVDHDVPVLRVEDEKGRLKAVLFGYACHNTTMDFYKWCGDYAGFAQIDLEKKYPGATALFVQGCGGDSNPLPRRKIELCEDYGRQLAQAVENVLGQPMRPVSGPVATRYEEIDLPLANIPGRAELEALIASKDRTQTTYGRRLLKMMDAGEPFQRSYPWYPVQAIQMGRQFTIVSLGGEVVVDYSLRLKKELGPQETWVLGYCNDTMAYIGSKRVIAEGGYEGATSMYVYGLPGKWSPAIEEMIVAETHKLVDEVRATTRPAD